VAVAGSKKKKRKAGSGWSWRLAGIALCAFFALGVITGLSESGRVLARRIHALLQRLPHSNRSDLVPAAYRAFHFEKPVVQDYTQSSALPVGRPRADQIALVEHADGFYQLDSTGRLVGPVSPAASGDLPILSGGGVENADPSKLLQYGGDLVRAEVQLSTIISEMRVSRDGELRLYLDRPHLVIIMSPDRFLSQLARISSVLQMWREHRELIGTIDTTVSDEAIVRPRSETLEPLVPVTAMGATRVVRSNSVVRRHQISEAIATR